MMKRFVASLVVFVVLVGCSRQVSPEVGLESLASWKGLGLVGDTDFSSTSSFAFAANGNPVVALSKHQSVAPFFGYKDLYIYQWVNGQWQALPGPLDIRPENHTEPADIAIDQLGRVVVAWSEGRSQSGRHNVYVKRWNGQNWQRLGGRLTLEAGEQFPSLAIDSQNRPVIAFSDFHEEVYKLYVKRWDNNSSWTQLGLEVDSGHVIQFTSHYPSLAIDSNDRIVVAWRGKTALHRTDTNIYVKRWNGSSWVSLGGILDVDPTGDSWIPSLVLSSSGQPYVAWRELANEEVNIYVKRWDGNGIWTLLGRSVGSTLLPRLATSGVNTVMVSWYDFNTNSTYVKRWNGMDRWMGVGAQPVVADGIVTAFAVSPAGVPILGYSKNSRPFVTQYR
jgi:hypothetical protein